ncbi:hypothetical protein [Chitinimonas lacunae]|uniref:Nucleotidyltransferase n=1 Tax=Chitinimonas lacunae TaxID=1963018 RepID=A0ABV8MM40_9NEIS
MNTEQGTSATHALPTPMPEGFPELFRARLATLVSHHDISDGVFRRLYFDLVICPQIKAALQEHGIASVFRDPDFDWKRHLDDRLAQRWRECRAGCDEEGCFTDTLRLLAGFRILAERLH